MRYYTIVSKIWETEQNLLDRINKHDLPAMAQVDYHSRFHEVEADLDTGRTATEHQNPGRKWEQVLAEKYPEFTELFTDGSKTPNGVAAVAL